MVIVSSWDSRRIVYTKKLIAFSNPNDDEVLDFIPLSEIIAVRDMSLIGEIADDASQFNAESVENEEASAEGGAAAIGNVLMIETKPEGYNSGRPYEIQAKTGQDFRALLQDVTKLSNTAREQAGARPTHHDSRAT